MVKLIQRLQRHLRFVPAAPKSTARHVAQTAAQASLFWLIFFAGLPLAIAWVEAHLLASVVTLPRFSFAGQWPLAAVAFALFGAINLWAGATMATVGRGTPFPLATAQRLVVRGPYRFVRNPMALGGLGAGMAIAFGMSSLLLATIVVAGGLLWHTIARPPEEADLLARFGERYRVYQREVSNWIPRLQPFAFDDAADGSSRQDEAAS